MEGHQGSRPRRNLLATIAGRPLGEDGVDSSLRARRTAFRKWVRTPRPPHPPSPRKRGPREGLTLEESLNCLAPSLSSAAQTSIPSLGPRLRGEGGEERFGSF